MQQVHRSPHVTWRVSVAKIELQFHLALCISLYYDLSLCISMFELYLCILFFYALCLSLNPYQYQKEKGRKNQDGIPQC